MSSPARAPLPVVELAAHLRPALLRLTRVVRQQRVDTSITLTQLSAMGALAKLGPVGPGELAAFERVQPPTLTRILASLEERDLVSRRPHPSDRRQVVVELTAAGLAALQSESDSRTTWLAQRLELLDDDERALLSRVVPLLDRLAES